MYEFEIENFKRLPFDERRKLLDKLIVEVKKLKKKVTYDEGPLIIGRSNKLSPHRKEWEEKSKVLTTLEREHNQLKEG